MLSRRAASISPSSTLAINAKVKELKSRGIDIVDFGIGEPDFDTPSYIKKAAIEAIDRGFTKYTPSDGITELRQAISRKLMKDGLDYPPEQIVISNGAKHSLANILFSILDKGDEVVIPVPYWASYPEMVKLADGVPVFAPAENFQLDARSVQAAVTKKTRAIIINSPNNPTGAVFSKKELAAVAKIAVENDIYVISDEIYEKFIYGAEHVSIASLGRDIFERTIIVNGFSKTYAMTGWRMGYAAGPADVMKAAAGIQSQMTSCPNSIAQMAALAAIGRPPERAMILEFKKRKEYVCSRLEGMGINFTAPKGAFYVFFHVGPASSTDFAAQLLENGVAVMPGKDFGDDRCVRMSYATSMKNLKNGLDRIGKFIKS